MIYKNDNEWYTQIKDVEYFINTIFEPHFKNWEDNNTITIWCPFDTEDSAFVKCFKKHGYNVIYSHIDNGEDFYTYEPNSKYDYIISNPPFKSKHNLLKRIKELKQQVPFIFLMTINMVNNGEFMKVYNSFKGREIFFIANRIYYSKNAKTLEPAGRPSFNSLWISANNLSIYDIQVIKTYEGAK